MIPSPPTISGQTSASFNRIQSALFLFLLTLAPAQLQAQLPSLITPAVESPRITYHTFQSRAAGREVSYHLYTPTVYDQEVERRFPVLYWLHGTAAGTRGIPPMTAWFDAAIRQGKIPPMLVVFPNGLLSSMWCNSKDDVVPMETIVIEELIPQVDATARTIPDRAGRIIEGFSMGGYGSARLGFKHAKLFCAVSILAGGPLDLSFAGPRATRNPEERARILKETFGDDMTYYKAQHPLTLAEQQADAVRGKILVRVAVGDRDDSAPLSRAYSEHLQRLEIPHTFSEVPDVAHETLPLLRGLGAANWEFYREALGGEN